MYPLTENTLTFTTTAMPRPDLIKKTYDSFTKNMLEFDFKKATLYINVDRFPDGRDDDKRKEVVEVARNYFGNVIANLPENPNFAQAVRWCFSKIETYYNFHLEDDWELLVPVKVSVFNQFFLSPIVQQIALRAWKNVKGNFYLSPSFLRGTFCREMAENMNDVDNPEVQIRNMKPNYKGGGFLYFPFEPRAVIIRDLGREWMKKNQYNRGSQNFVQWSNLVPGKGREVLADQNAQIPMEMLPTNPNDKRLAAMNRWVKAYSKQRAIKLNRRGKIT